MVMEFMEAGQVMSFDVKTSSYKSDMYGKTIPIDDIRHVRFKFLIVISIDYE